ncbi:MAG: polysaccharide deacetylase family protein [Proteocatella sp.]
MKLTKKQIKKFLNKITVVFTIMFMLAIQVSYANPSVINRGNPNVKQMSLTFDDGGSAKNVRSVIDTLDKYNVKATFFFVGSFIEKNPELMKDIVSRGHDVANHSYSHPELTKLSYAKVKNELLKSQTILKNITGQEMKPYLRPPYGSHNSTVLKAAADTGHSHIVMWNVDTEDWKGKTPIQLTKHVVSNSGNGNIVLMHTASSSNSYKALPDIIQGLQSKGYELVTISELLEKSQNIQKENIKLGTTKTTEITTPSVSILKYEDDNMLQTEFLSNLIYVKTGILFSTNSEIEMMANKLGILDGNLTENKNLSRKEMLEYISHAYSETKDIEKKFENIKFNKSNLQTIIEVLKTI